jgi:hypothetical protein
MMTIATAQLALTGLATAPLALIGLTLTAAGATTKKVAQLLERRRS